MFVYCICMYVYVLIRYMYVCMHVCMYVFYNDGEVNIVVSCIVVPNVDYSHSKR